MEQILHIVESIWFYIRTTFEILLVVSLSSSVADLRGGAPPSSPKFLHFHAVFGKNWPNNRLAPPPLGLAPPPLENPGSATDHNIIFEINSVDTLTEDPYPLTGVQSKAFLRTCFYFCGGNQKIHVLHNI